MTSNVTYDLEEFCSRYGIKNGLGNVLNELPSPSTTGPWIAGGSLRRLVSGDNPLASDIDYFFASEEQFRVFDKSMSEKSRSTYETKTAKTYLFEFDGATLKIQAIMMRWYTDPAEVIDSFDFTICQLVYDGDKLHVGPYALWDISRKRISVHKITYGASSVRRLLKYASQGYTVCHGAAGELLRQVSSDPSTIQPTVEYVD